MIYEFGKMTFYPLLETRRTSSCSDLTNFTSVSLRSDACLIKSASGLDFTDEVLYYVVKFTQ